MEKCIFELNWRRFVAIEDQSNCNWSLEELMKQSKRFSQVLGAKYKVWKVWGLNSKILKLASDQIWVIEEHGGSNYKKL